MKSVHDNIVLSYTVDLHDRAILLRTATDRNSNPEIVEVEFKGVLTHYFDCPLHGSIIFDIGKQDLPKFIAHNITMLADKKKFSWPMDYKTTDDLLTKLSDGQYIYVVIYSSFGLGGWVLAKDYCIK